jgi:signal transduction histidine kinase
VGVTQPRSEVYGYLYQNIYWAALISLIIAVCSVLLAWKGTRRLLAPINALHGEVLNISRGDLDHIVPIDREDEIADLSRAFNEMTGSLKKYLDQEVETACTLAHHKSLAILGTVASEVSHEVRNSLLGVQMMLNGLKREPLSPSGQEVVKIIEKEMEQNSSLVKGFLKIARKPDLKLARGPLDGLIREVLDRIRPEAGSRGIAVTLNWDPAIPHIRMDAALINNAFANLVKNSVEAMNGSGSLAITGKIAQEEILVSVSDTGSGMDSETLERIFEPFFSTKGDQGIGLGLAIVKSNIEAHGWTIECASSPGKGAEFIIRVPLD